MQDTMTAARVVVTSEAYPSSLRPSGSSASAFWTGDENDRTFFAVETTEGDKHLVLVLGQDDSRSLYMRGPESMDDNERAALEAAGLDPFNHKVWTIDREHVAFVEQTHMTPEMEQSLREVTEPTIENLAAERAQMEEERDAAKAEAERLQVRLNSVEDALRREQERLAEARRQHAADIEQIGDRLIEECETRSWCEEYDSVVSDLNGSLNIPLREREREWSVTLDVTVRVTRTVMATNADAAGEIASEGVDSNDVQYGDIEEVEVYETEEA